MRRDGNVVSLRHCRDAANLRDPAGVAQVGLNHVPDPALEKLLEIPAAVKALAESDGYAGQTRELLEPFNVFTQERFFDEKRPDGFQQHGELLSHRSVHATVKVECDIKTLGLHSSYTLQH